MAWEQTDYRELLIKYLYHVGDREGTDFLGYGDYIDGRFSDSEWAVLKRLELESRSLAWAESERIGLFEEGKREPRR